MKKGEAVITGLPDYRPPIEQSLRCVWGLRYLALIPLALMAGFFLFIGLRGIPTKKPFLLWCVATRLRWSDIYLLLGCIVN